MSWLRLDDVFDTHPKILELGTDERRWTWVKILIYTTKHRSPQIPPHIRAVVPKATQKFVKTCVSLGLVDETTDGKLEVHDWHQYQAGDPKKALRQAKWRKSVDGDVDAPVDGDVDGDVDALVDASRVGARARPVPYLKNTPPNPPTGGNHRKSKNDRRTERFANSLLPAEREVWSYIHDDDQAVIVAGYQAATGLRFVRGTHGTAWKADPLGEDKPSPGERNQLPANAGKPTQSEYLRAYSSKLVAARTPDTPNPVFGI